MPEISFAVLIASVIGLVQVVKMIGLSDKFAPLLSIGFGIALSFISQIGTTTPDKLLLGIIVGLSSVGLWSGTKNTIQALKES